MLGDEGERRNRDAALAARAEAQVGQIRGGRFTPDAAPRGQQHRRACPPQPPGTVHAHAVAHGEPAGRKGNCQSQEDL